MVIKSGVCFVCLFVLVDAILLNLDFKKSPSYDLEIFDDFEYSSLRRFQKYLVCERSPIFLFILKLNHSDYIPTNVLIPAFLVGTAGKASNG